MSRGLATHIHDVDYKKMRKKNPPELVEAMPHGIWVPVSVAAFLLKCSGQSIHLMRLTKQLKSIRFPKGPILVNIERFMAEENKDEK